MELLKITPIVNLLMCLSQTLKSLIKERPWIIALNVELIGLVEKSQTT